MRFCYGFTFAIALPLLACTPPPDNDPLTWKGGGVSVKGGAGGNAGIGGTGGNGGGGGNSDGSADLIHTDGGSDLPLPGIPACKVTVSFLTAALNYGYQPKNVGVAWIASADDKLVKTTNLWGGARFVSMHAYRKMNANAGLRDPFTSFWKAVPRVWPPLPAAIDAITSATATSHVMRTGSWNCLDYRRQLVPDGQYKVCFEITDNDSPGSTGDIVVGTIGTKPARNSCVRFTKGPMPQVITPPDVPGFKTRTINYSPLP